uniref:Caspase apoptotic cysteine protease n=1 Tax=Rhipicephalus zambeziensis TaxID=60191 RepID=A0A224YLA6_9ACAR
MSHPRRGKCVIFNYHSFKSHISKFERTGTDVDAKSLQSCFGWLGFETVIHHDLSVNKTKETLENLGKQDYSDDDCFVCCCLTHGDRNHLYGTDGKFSVDDIVKPFLDDACPSLIGKPKLFFIQACRGTRYDSGAPVVFDTADSPTWSYRIPDHPDILLAYSTVPGFYSWRNQDKGSWFIQALCSVLRRLAGSEDLLSMLTVVNCHVALKFESDTGNPRTNGMKQVPSITSSLLRRVWFKPKIEEAHSQQHYQPSQT